MAAEAEPTTLPTDYVRVKRKKSTIFLYMEPNDSVHDLRARINHITKVPTTDDKFFIDINGEVEVAENKSLADQKASRSPHTRMISHAHPRSAAPAFRATGWQSGFLFFFCSF